MNVRALVSGSLAARAAFAAFLTCAFAAVAFGQEPEWWTKQKRDCGLPASLAYNSWDGRCPARERSSIPATSSTPDNSAAEQAERERIAREADERRAAAEAEAKRQAAEFARDRDSTVLKGSSATPTLKGDSTAEGLKGSRANESVKPAAPATPPFQESEFFYALQTRKFEPLNDSGHPILANKTRDVIAHGLVGGTSWTYGFRWARQDCDAKCRADTIRAICADDPHPSKCNESTLPFTAGDYDMVVSMASYHNFFADLVSRVVLDGSTLGEFTREHSELFEGLQDKEFDTLDCHSNGAMLCLAALRSGITKAKTVRLFGPQINPAAAAQWKALGINVEIYINNGDPVPALSWKMPMTKPAPRGTFVPAWAPVVAVTRYYLPAMVWNAFKDADVGSMDANLLAYGFKVHRLPCSRTIKFDCHAMRGYEANTK